MIVVVDYKAGNLKSVETAMQYLGADFTITDRPEEVVKADKLIVPGVGEARAAMENLKSRGLDSALEDFFDSGKFLLGICIGIQLFFERSEERDTECLGFLKGKVVRFPEMEGLKVPHMGWNQVEIVRDTHLTRGIESGSSFYFVHSYYPLPEDEKYIIGETDYGIRFTSAVQWENLFAVQFHPEKSGRSGLKLLSNFVSM